MCFCFLKAAQGMTRKWQAPGQVSRHIFTTSESNVTSSHNTKPSLLSSMMPPSSSLSSSSSSIAASAVTPASAVAAAVVASFLCPSPCPSPCPRTTTPTNKNSTTLASGNSRTLPQYPPPLREHNTDGTESKSSLALEGISLALRGISLAHSLYLSLSAGCGCGSGSCCSAGCVAR